MRGMAQAPEFWWQQSSDPAAAGWVCVGLRDPAAHRALADQSARCRPAGCECRCRRDGPAAPDGRGADASASETSARHRLLAAPPARQLVWETRPPATSGSRESNLLQNIKPVTLVRFNTTRGVVVVDVHHDCVAGLAQFLSLVVAGFYDGCAFSALSGPSRRPASTLMHASRATTAQQASRRSLFRALQRSGDTELCHEWPNTRSTQFSGIWWTMPDLMMGFTPFGKVRGDDGLQVIDSPGTVKTRPDIERARCDVP